MTFNLLWSVWKGVKKATPIIDGVMQAKEVYDFVQNMRSRAEAIESNAYDE
jgi:hypothetical protein